jgi:hypothetical protein
MANISVDTFLDGGTARTAGEVWTIQSGATLTIRTDTRWHANAPASMTGSLGAVSMPTIAGGYKVDGTKVRWAAFTGGTGNVPAIGTTITQGSVSGYLLGVWVDLTTAPTAVGAAMPSAGFIKFREVTTGPFAAGSVSGIGATVSPDVTGWIEVVHDTAVQLAGVVNGLGYQFNGDWFYLGTTNGSRGQTFQLPTNGGGAGTWGLGVQIETAPGSGVFEWYPGFEATNGWLTTQIATDARAKCVEVAGGGLIRIGANAAAASIGYLPASGCLVRTPNIFLRQCATATRSQNMLAPASLSSRPYVNASGAVSMSICSCDWGLFSFANQPKSIAVTDTIIDTAIALTGTTGATFTRCAIGATNAPSGGAAIFTGTIGTTINDFKVFRRGGQQAVYFSYCYSATVSNLFCFAASTTQQATLNITAFNSTFSTIRTYGGGINFSYCSNVTLDGHDYIDRPFGNTTTAGNQSCVTFTSSSNCTYKNLTFGAYGALDNCNPYVAIIATGGGNSNILACLAGTAASPLSCGSSSTTYPNYLFNCATASADSNFKVKQLFATGLRGGLYGASTTPIGSTNFVFENCVASYTTTLNSAGISPNDSLFKGCGATFGATFQGFGNYISDVFTSTTTGRIVFQINPVTTSSSTYFTSSIAASAAGGVGSNTDKIVYLVTVGDYIIYEMPYFMKGHTSFQNVAFTTGAINSSNMSFQYQIDTGSGWNGTWKTLSGANLSAETVNVAGTKLKFKITCTTASTTNSFNYLYIPTNTTVTAYGSNLYPLSTVTLGFTNLVTGSEVRVYTGTDPATAVEIGGTESTAGSTFSFTHSSGGVTGVIAVFALGYQPIYLPYTFKSTDDSILIQQVVDRNYVNP